MAESRINLEQLFREWNDGGLRFIVVSCKELEYIDSAGLSTLIGALHRLRREGGDLVLTELNPKIGAMFEVSSMEKYFEVFKSRTAATRHLKEQAAERLKKGKSGTATPAKRPGKPKPRTRVIAKARSKR